MNLQNHVPCLETCRRMKELGYGATQLRWKDDLDGLCVQLYSDGYTPKDPYSGRGGKYDFPAPLVSEIMEELPESFSKDEKIYTLRISKEDGYYRPHYASGDGMYYSLWYITSNRYLAEALALLWISLKEQSLI